MTYPDPDMAEPVEKPGAKKTIPRPVLLFVGKGTLLFIVWKLAYIGLFRPGRVLDDPLTTTVGVLTTKCLNVTSGANHYTVRKIADTASADMGGTIGKSMEIYRDAEPTLKVADPCNGLELMVLYAGFLICYPGPVRRKLSFVAGGWLLIMAANILRCMLLVLIFVHSRKYLDFSHHFFFTLVVYAMIFWLWWLFTRRTSFPGRAATPASG